MARLRRDVITPLLAGKIQRAARDERAAHEERDALIRQAVAAGGSLREVGELAGLSHTAISFIVYGRGPRGRRMAS